jgi:hypothetical protein
MKKLYKVQVSIEMMVMSDDEQGAIDEGAKHVFTEIEEYGMYAPISIEYKDQVPSNWVDSVPYNGTQQCNQIISGLPATEPEEAAPAPPPKPVQLNRPPAQLNPTLDFGSFVGRPTKKSGEEPRSGLVDNSKK